MTKPRIHQNAWDNWYGYLGTKRVIAFANSSTETAEQSAHRWLQEQSAQGQRNEGAGTFIPCPDCSTGHLVVHTDATVNERYAPAVFTVTFSKGMPRRTRPVTIAACTGCETILEMRHGQFVRSEEVA